jgi:hypothetical protein
MAPAYTWTATEKTTMATSNVLGAVCALEAMCGVAHCDDAMRCDVVAVGHRMRRRVALSLTRLTRMEAEGALECLPPAQHTWAVTQCSLTATHRLLLRRVAIEVRDWPVGQPSFVPIPSPSR